MENTTKSNLYNSRVQRARTANRSKQDVEISIAVVPDEEVPATFETPEEESMNANGRGPINIFEKKICAFGKMFGYRVVFNDS